MSTSSPGLKSLQFRWSVRQYLVTLALVFFGVGFVVYIQAWADGMTYSIVGPWYRNVLDLLVDKWQVNEKLVTHYIVFALTAIPGWITLAGMCCFLVLLRARLMARLSIIIVLCIPLAAIVIDFLISWTTVVQPNLRIVSLLGAVICFAAWLIATRILRDTSQSTMPEFPQGTIRRMLAIAFLIFYILVGSLGWQGLGAAIDN